MDRDYSIFDDDQLFDFLKEDDQKAFYEIYARFHDFLFTYAFRLTGSEEESQDILQSLFLNLWTKRHSLAISGKLLGYLHQSVRYGFLNNERRRTVFSKYQNDLLSYLQEGVADIDDYLFEKELIARLRRLAEDMPGKGGQAFLMSYFENLSHAEIAEVLNVSEKTVRNLLSKSVKDIRLKVGLGIALFLLLS